MQLLDAEQLRARLPRAGLRLAQREALKLSAEGRALSTPRMVIPFEGGGLGFMGAVGPGGLLGGKMVCVIPENSKHGLNPHQGLAVLFHPGSGRVLLAADASTLTALRTAAASAAATHELALPHSSVLTIIGSGTQALEHAEAILPLRHFRELRIAGRNSAAVRSLAKRFQDRVPKISELENAEEAVHGAHVICLCTASQEPYLQSSQLSPGAHVNAIGACRPGAREIVLHKDELRIFVDSAAACREEASELAGFEELPEIGSVFSLRKPGRRHAHEITLFKSVGIGIEDVAALSLAHSLC